MPGLRPQGSAPTQMTDIDLQRGADGVYGDGEPTEDMGGAEEGGSNVSPEEQAQYDKFVDAGFQAIYNEKTMPQVLEMLKGNGQPVDGLANTAAMIVMRLEDSAKQSGKELSPDIVYHGGVELLEDLANLAKEAKIHEYSEEELQGAMYQALDIYRNMRQQDGSLDMEAINQEFGQILEADKAGRLGEVLPGVEEQAGAGARTQPSGGGGGGGLMSRAGSKGSM